MTAEARDLAELLAAAGIPVAGPVPRLAVTQVTDDSRRVREGGLFVAVRGASADGHRFAQQAAARGARAVMLEEDVALPEAVVKLRVPSTRPLLGPLLHAFHGDPSGRLQVVGVTGTKGKTTVTWLIHHLLQRAGIPCGLIGTVCNRIGDEERPSGSTTPGAAELQGMLAEMAAGGIEACAMEVSSHALDQERTAGIRWAGGVFTNFGPEHLDYHGSLERYLQAKLKLFKALPRSAAAAINRSDPAWEKVRCATQGRALTYALGPPADFWAEGIEASLDGISCRVQTPEGAFPVSCGLIGLHNLENILAALGAAAGLGLPLRRAAEGLADFPGVPGRLERIEAGQVFPVFVDYAHTEGSLRRVLEQLKTLSSRRILTVFGCGGDRDRAKRPRMGRAAAELSDRVIVTTDNPRSEDPEQIAREILSGMEGISTPREIRLDRREAIAAALESAGEEWLVLIAGKGHEERQIFSDRTVPFDDRTIARELLTSSSRMRGSGPRLKISRTTASIPARPRESEDRGPRFRGDGQAFSGMTQRLVNLIPEFNLGQFSGVSIDTRTLRAGELFVAIRGKRFDGHDFIEEAVRRGASGVVAERLPQREHPSVPFFKVDDTLQALGTLARLHRDRFSVPLAAVTGSCGKSTTKGMLAHLLSARQEVLATAGTQNNRVGVPLTLFRLEERHRAAVLELGTNQWGEVRTLTEIARPTLGLITNIGPAHLEAFGDLEGVLRAKSELWEAMAPEAPVVLNRDDPLLRRAGEKLKRRVVWFGFGEDADLRATEVSLRDAGSRCRVNGRWDLNLPAPGRHNVANALAALACAQEMGEELSSAVERLSDAPGLAGRLNRIERDGLTILDDSYNSNPASLKAALEVLKAQAGSARRIVAVGDMLELGSQARALHEEAGRAVVAAGSGFLVTVGLLSRRLLAAAWEAGLPREAGRAFDSAEEAGEFLMGIVRPGDLVLVKGSRGMQMEKALACFITSSIH